MYLQVIFNIGQNKKRAFTLESLLKILQYLYLYMNLPFAEYTSFKDNSKHNTIYSLSYIYILKKRVQLITVGL